MSRDGGCRCLPRRAPRRDRGARRRGVVRAVGGPAVQDPPGPRALHGGRGQERHLLPRRRHGHPRSPPPATTSGVDRASSTSTGCRSPASTRRGRSSRPPPRRTCPTTTRTRPPPARCGRPARRRSTSGSRRARAAPTTCPGKNLQTVLELAQKRGHEGRQRLDRGDHRRDAGRARLAHLAARLPGPGRTRRACPTETKAAGGLGSIAEQDVDHKRRRRSSAAAATASTQTITGGPDAGKTVDAVRRRARATTYVTDAAGLAAATRSRQAGARPLHRRQHDDSSGPARRATLGDGQRRRQRCTEDHRPANEPSLADMTRKAIKLLESNRKGFFLQVEGASIDKQDHAANACGQIGETVAFDKAIGVALDYQRSAPRHADRRHRRPRAHEPDRRRGRERHRHADRLLDQPAHQGRPDAAPHLRHRRLRRRRRAPAARRRASSTPAPWCPSGAAARARAACSAPTTTPTCSILGRAGR